MYSRRFVVRARARVKVPLRMFTLRTIHARASFSARRVNNTSAVTRSASLIPGSPGFTRLGNLDGVADATPPSASDNARLVVSCRE